MIPKRDPDNREPRYQSPATPSGALALRFIAFPDNPEYENGIMDMLNLLGKAELWSEDGSGSSQQSAWDMRDMFSSFLKNPLVGMIVPVVIGTLPDWMIYCDGDQYEKDEYPALWDVIAPQYKVSATEFRVPDLRQRMMVGANPLNPLYEVTATGGAATVALTTDQMPAHTHSTQPHSHFYRRNTNTIIAQGEAVPATVGGPASDSLTAPDVTVAVNSAGGGQAHNNMPPYFALNFAIIAK